MVHPLHLEMIGLLNGCIETMSWLIVATGIDTSGSMEDSKTNSVVMVNNDDINDDVNVKDLNVKDKEWNFIELEQIKKNVISLREVVCEFIAMTQQWLKILNNAIDRKQAMTGDVDTRKQSLVNID